VAWTIEFERGAQRSFDKLPDPIAIRIAATLKKVAAADNPRLRGIAMAGEWPGHWRYRIGDYRVIARIEEGRMIIVVVSVGHRREVYR
jgi:mRNA interferase RelE/StbE